VIYSVKFLLVIYSVMFLLVIYRSTSRPILFVTSVLHMLEHILLNPYLQYHNVSSL